MALHSLCNSLSLRIASSSRKWIGDAKSLRKSSQSVAIKPSRLQARAEYAGYTSPQSTTTLRTNGTQGARRVFVNYTFYKTRGAMSMKPVKPVFKLLDTGNAVLDREGSLFLEFAPPVAQRQYDWNSKQIFALSVMELGTLVGLAPGESCEFYHDPNMGKSDAGKIRKSLKVNPMKDEDGYYFNLSVVNKQENLDERVNIALTRAEYSVMRSSINYIIPYLMGWHVFVDPSTVDDFLADDEPVGSMTTKNEWDK
ncbi:protein MpWHIRLY [Marchantia polymorpha subsp. ruderalis]|uniref:WHY domain class transcription factor n=2 Tax=Marchantia polymorpha TaxID=3197 RepID=A0AAF6AWD8_MARPO|nr:hypothetical protein MARPO_0007s0156 [Marchantia polymorpha]BAS31043.1 hypothetical protein [Marchantia polymorpha]BBN04072.1 hypothetical protein Mp_3g01640 [Marchantia polymorpha subsp. ruderalis]|eukprot:PTQ47759.1 hypothetical protein MARPO_0007s0156 [Marchantia polymorpha]